MKVGRNWRWIATLVGLVGLVLLFAWLSGSPAPTPRPAPEPTTPAATTPSPASPTPEGVLVPISVQGGEATVTGLSTVRVGRGDPVLLSVTADAADVIHVHGYNLKKRTNPGGTVEVAFLATKPGSFVVELEKSGLRLCLLRVT